MTFSFCSLIYSKILIEDPRVKEWLWMDTPVTTCVILVLYLVALKAINFFMKEREAFSLKWVLIVYNFAQVCGSFYVFSEV